MSFSLTLSSLGCRVGTTGAPLLLYVVGLPPAPHTQSVRLVLPLAETGRSLGLHAARTNGGREKINTHSYFHTRAYKAS